MTPLPYTEPGARVVFDVAVGGFAVMEAVVRQRSRRNREGESSDRGSLIVVALAVGGGIGGACVLAGTVRSASIAQGQWLLFIAGLIAIVAGVTIRLWAILELGAFFTVDVRVHDGQPVIDSGPYRWVRHPSYGGLLLTCVGIGLALGNWLALAAAIVLPTIGLAARIRVEERALTAALGEPYRRFAATRARLIPGCW